METHPASASTIVLPPPFPDDRDGILEFLQAKIDAGQDVENTKRLLRAVRRTYPAEEVVTNPELVGLHPDALKRLLQLEEIERVCGPYWNKDDKANYEAVRNAYLNLGLELDSNKAVFFFNGKMKTGVVDWPGYALEEALPQWQREEGGIGRLWVEKYGVPTQQAMQATFPPIPPANRSHSYTMAMRCIPDQNNPNLANAIGIFTFLDDTGSDCFELFAFPDLDYFGIDVAYAGMGPMTLVNTAGGVVMKQSIIMYLALVVNGALAGPWKIMDGLVTPYPAIPGYLRCSGVYLRSSLFTATQPDGMNNLHVAEKKNGVTSKLRPI